MYQVVIALIVIVCVLLIFIVLVQNSKGGGLASNFSSSNQIMGVRKTADFLEKATWTFAGVLLVLSFVAVMALPKGGVQGAAIDKEIMNIPTQNQQTPNFPIPEDSDAGNIDLELE
jgi:preprotein translocase subunit SecG